MAIAGLQPTLRHVLETAGLIGFIPAFSSVIEAVNAVESARGPN